MSSNGEKSPRSILVRDRTWRPRSLQRVEIQEPDIAELRRPSVEEDDIHVSEDDKDLAREKRALMRRRGSKDD